MVIKKLQSTFAIFDGYLSKRMYSRNVYKLCVGNNIINISCPSPVWVLFPSFVLLNVPTDWTFDQFNLGN